MTCRLLLFSRISKIQSTEAVRNGRHLCVALRLSSLSTIMFSSLLFALGALVAVRAQSSSNAAVVCVAGQCLQGYTNITIGATLSAPGAETSLILLPDQYTSTTNPELLHQLLTSSSASLSASAGFQNSSSVSLPLNVALGSGLAVYSQSLYSGEASFVQLPNTTNHTTPLTAGSVVLSNNVYAAFDAGLNNRIIVWDSIPDVSQLESFSSGNLSLVSLQSTSCSPTCSGSGVCNANGTCTCPAGFTGSSCESCASGFFGPQCQPCPSNCTTCDDGINGSGLCLSQETVNPLTTCNCINGECQSNGQCACNAGWATASNGTACATCEPGFFLTTDGSCRKCSIGCTSCADGTGDCTTCASGFTQDTNDRTKCDAAQSVTSSGIVCPSGSFSNGTACQPCASSCQTCNGPTSNDCILCASGTYSFNGSCVTTDSNGVCEGTGGLIANNNNKECDTCGGKCTACAIPSFNVASTLSQVQCTDCLEGYVLSNGQCLSSCPAGTFLSPKDNLTCTACDSSCGTCSGSATFCLTCANNKLASSGSCVSSCPSNTFSSSGSCLPCHPDCATCSGGSFNQCTSCNSNLPVLTSGRCLATCSSTEFFDKTSSSCQACDSSCSSCSGAGPSNCLSCSSSSQVVRNGACVSANCNGTSAVVTGLGVCLSELVEVPQSSGTSTAAPLPSITGINSPTTITVRRTLTWWEILLMTLGCAFIFLLFVMCWRRRMRRVRAKQTRAFAQSKGMDNTRSWRRRIADFFGYGNHGKGRSGGANGSYPVGEDIKLLRLRDAEEARHQAEMDKIIGAYAYPHSMFSPSFRTSFYPPQSTSHAAAHHPPSLHSSQGSLYSHITGMPRRTADARQPVRQDVTGGGELRSRFSMTTLDSLEAKKPSSTPQTDAEQYAKEIRTVSAQSSPRQSQLLNHQPQPGSYWLVPVPTGNSSNNPFRKG